MSSSFESRKSSPKIEKKPYIRSIEIKGKFVDFIVKDAMYTKILDEETLLDEISIDFMLDEIAVAIGSNLSKNNPLPKTIILSSEDLSAYTQNDNTLSQPVINQYISPPNSHGQTEPSVEITPASSTNNHPNLSSNSNTDNITNTYTKADEKVGTNVTNSSNTNTIANSNTDTNTTTKNDSESDSLEKTVSATEFLKVYPPRYTFDDVYVDPAFKKRIVTALIMAKQRNLIYNDWGLIDTFKSPRPLVLNFYGPPGTGKSMMAEAIANYLGRMVFLVNYSELESGTPGDTPKNIIKCFKLAKESNAVLIFDEADSFLGKRLTNVTSAADNSINVTRSVILIELEKFDGVLIFTTNFISNYDIAFKRRILASIEFKLPDEKGRAQIWSTHIPKQLPLSPGITPSSLAYKYGGTTGADIKDIVLFAAVNCLEKGRERLSWEDFDEAYQAVKNRYSVI